MTLCPACQQEPATTHQYYGVLNGYNCRELQAAAASLAKPIEVTTEEIRQARREHADEIEQPFREGVVNSRYLELYGPDRIKATPQELKAAQDVFREDHYYRK